MRILLSLILSVLLTFPAPLWAESLKAGNLSSRIEKSVNEQLAQKNECTFEEMTKRIDNNSVTWSCVESAVTWLEGQRQEIRHSCRMSNEQTEKLAQKIQSWKRSYAIVDYINYLNGTLTQVMPQYVSGERYFCNDLSLQERIRNRRHNPSCFRFALLYFQGNRNAFNEEMMQLALEGKAEFEKLIAELSPEQQTAQKWTIRWEQRLYDQLSLFIKGGQPGGYSDESGGSRAIPTAPLLPGWPRALQESQGKKSNAQLRALLEKLLKTYEQGADLTAYIEELVKGSANPSDSNYVSAYLLNFSFVLYAKSIAANEKERIFKFIRGNYPLRVKWAAAQAIVGVESGKFSLSDADKTQLLTVFAGVNKNLSKENREDLAVYQVLLYLTSRLYDSPAEKLRQATESIASSGSGFEAGMVVVAVLPSTELATALEGAALSEAALVVGAIIVVGIAFKQALSPMAQRAFNNLLRHNLETEDGEVEELFAGATASVIRDGLNNNGEWIITKQLTNALGDVVTIEVVLESEALRENMVMLSSVAGATSVDTAQAFQTALRQSCNNFRRSTPNRNKHARNFEDIFNKGDEATQNALKNLTQQEKNIIQTLKQQYNNGGGELTQEFWQELAKKKNFPNLERIGKIGVMRSNYDGFLRAVYRKGQWMPELETTIDVVGTQLKDLVGRDLISQLVTCGMRGLNFFDTTGMPFLSLPNNAMLRYVAHEQVNGHFHYEFFETLDDGMKILCNKSVNFGKGKRARDLFLDGLKYLCQ